MKLKHVDCFIKLFQELNTGNNNIDKRNTKQNEKLQKIETIKKTLQKQ